MGFIKFKVGLVLSIKSTYYKLSAIYFFSVHRFAINQENEFNIEIPVRNEKGETLDASNYKVMFSKSIVDCMFHVYVFDEFIAEMENVKVNIYYNFFVNIEYVHK